MKSKLEISFTNKTKRWIDQHLDLFLRILNEVKATAILNNQFKIVGITFATQEDFTKFAELMAHNTGGNVNDQRTRGTY